MSKYLTCLQGREAKHIRLAKYVDNTCNVRRHLRWPTVFRHEFVSLVLLRENDPFYTSPRQSKKDGGESFIRKEVQKGDNLTCHCGLSKSVTEEGCKICTSNITAMIKSSVESGRVTDAHRCFSNS